MECRNHRTALHDVQVGEAQDPETLALKMGIPSAVAFERVAMTVMTEAVGLDDQPAVPPEEVDLVRANPGIDLWLGKAVAATEAEEEPLELRPGEIGLRRSRWSGSGAGRVRGGAPDGTPAEEACAAGHGGSALGL